MSDFFYPFCSYFPVLLHIVYPSLHPISSFSPLILIYIKGRLHTLTTLEIWSHCSWVGSTPVGLWAQAWRRTTVFLGAFCKRRRKKKNRIWIHLIINHRSLLLGTIATYMEIFQHAINVKTVGLLIKVGVLLQVKTSVLHDRDVVTPGRVGDDDVLGMGEPGVQESSTNTESTSTGDGLGNGKLLTRNIYYVSTFIFFSKTLNKRMFFFLLFFWNILCSQQ
jgi:hypothetical protein